MRLLLSRTSRVTGTTQYLRMQSDIRLVEQPVLESAPDNWSRAVRETTGEFVKILCADDLLDPTCLERQESVLELHPKVSMVVSARRIVTARGHVLIPRLGLGGNSRHVESLDAVRIMSANGGNPFGEVGSILFRGSVLRACLPWPTTYGYKISLAMYARVLGRGDMFSLNEVHSSFRIGHKSWSHSVRRTQYRDQRILVDAVASNFGLRLSRIQRLGMLCRARLRQTMRQVLTTVARLLDRVLEK